MFKNFILLLSVTIVQAASAQSYLLPDRPSVLPQLAPFYHGVASGDPLTDRIIIWTRVTIGVDSTVNLNWQIATDTGFDAIVNSGTVTTDSSLDYTVKVDVTGLQPNTWYYYRFQTSGVNSITGRTRTAPTGTVDSLRIAVFSCSNFQAGYFNAYHDIAIRNDLDVLMHLGDWYYEYKAGGYAYDGDSNRLHPETHDAYTLADYRLWHSQYRLDQDLRDMLQQYPIITIWDDHETANNSWYGGAQNHNPATEGDWFVRKDAAKKAYFEWMPIREVAPDDDTIIHRTEKWGDLLNFIMLDTRYEDRDSSLGSEIPTNDSLLTDTNRNMLGPEQLAWFKTQLADASVKWRIIGNQVMIAPLAVGQSILNGDQWDGYPAERKRVFDYIMQSQTHNVVFLTGDIHTSWANDLPHPDSTYNPQTGAGSVGTEFIGTSITSPGLTSLNYVTPSLIESVEPHVKYVELTLHGYLLLDINKQRVQGDFIHVNTVTSRNYTASDDQYWMNLDGERFLRQAPGPLGTKTGNPGLLPPVVTGINHVNPPKMVVVTCFPNPAENEVALQYYLYQPAAVTLSVVDMNGKTIYSRPISQQGEGLYNAKIYLDDFAAGNYFVTVTSGGNTYTKQIVKTR